MLRKVMAVTALGLVLTAAGNAAGQVNLTEDAAWMYRIVGPDGPGEWTEDLEEAVAVADLPEPIARWPRRWRTFVPWDPSTPTLPGDTDPADVIEVPAAITLQGVSACRATLPPYPPGVLDFTVGHGAPWKGRWAYAFGEMRASEEGKATLLVRSAGPLTLWLGGRVVLETDRAGEASASVDLAKGPHVVAARASSGADRWWFGGKVLPPGPRANVEARCAFEVEDPGRFASLTVVGPEAADARLNGEPIERPLPDMHGSRVRGVSAAKLTAGRNVLSRTLSLDRVRKRIEGKAPGRLDLLGLRARDARVAMGPVVVAEEGTAVRIVVAANARVPAALRIDGRKIESPAAVFHRWTVDELKPSTDYTYEIALGQGEVRRATVRTLPRPDEPIQIALVGDPQSGEPWRKVAAAVRKAGPDLLVIAGDLVVDGWDMDSWQSDFVGPADDLLASMPCLAVPGNHDRYAAMFDVVFGAENDRKWARTAGGAMLAGIDGGLDWTPDSPHTKWLKDTLEGATDRLAFVVTHYPAYSSRNHGKLASDGRVLEWTSRTARRRIVPILQRHGVAALFAGHDHGYERSELPGGLSAIVTGGGGAGTYPKREDAEKQNPYSKAFDIDRHYSLLTICGRAATLRVLAPDGHEIDRRSWSAEPEKESKP